MRGGSHERAGGRERSRRRRLLGMGRGACFGKVRLRKGRGSGGERNGGRGRGAAGTGAQGDGRTDVKARDGGCQGVGHVARWTWASAAYGRGGGQVSALPESAYAYRTALSVHCRTQVRSKFFNSDSFRRIS
jgi:hypothetical protein